MEEKIKQDLLIEALNKGDLEEFKKIANSMENPNFKTEQKHVIEERQGDAIIKQIQIGSPFLIERLCDMDGGREYIQALIDTGKVDLSLKTTNKNVYKDLTLSDVIGIVYPDLVPEEKKQDLLIEAVNKGDLEEFKKIANSMENLNFKNGRGYFIEALCNDFVGDGASYIKALLDTGKIDLSLKCVWDDRKTLADKVNQFYPNLVPEEKKQDLLSEAVNKGDLEEFKKIANSMENPNFKSSRGYFIENLCSSGVEKTYIKALLDTGKIDLSLKGTWGDSKTLAERVNQFYPGVIDSKDKERSGILKEFSNHIESSKKQTEKAVEVLKTAERSKPLERQKSVRAPGKLGKSKKNGPTYEK